MFLKQLNDSNQSFKLMKINVSSTTCRSVLNIVGSTAFFNPFLKNMQRVDEFLPCCLGIIQIYEFMNANNFKTKR